MFERIPVELKQLKVIKSTMDFYDFDEFEAVVRGAAKVDQRALLVVLFGGEVGLRSGSRSWPDTGISRRRSAT